MTRLVVTAQTRDERDRVYARIETGTASTDGALSSVRLGTLARELLDLDPVRAAEQEGEEIPMDALPGHYEERLRADFEERPLAAFVDDLSTRTPYTRSQAEVIVTCGWFELDTESAVRLINQHLRAPYQEITVETATEQIRDAREARDRIHNTEEYPFGL